MKRYCYILILIVSTFIIASCSPSKNNKGSQNLDIANNFVIEDIDLSILGMSNIYEMIYSKYNDKIFISGKSIDPSQGDSCLIIASRDFKSFENANLNLKEYNEKIMCFDLNDDGTSAIVTKKTNNEDDIYFLNYYSTDFNLISRERISVSYDKFRVSDILFCDDMNIYIFVNCYEENQYRIIRYNTIDKVVDFDYELSEIDWIESVGRSLSGDLVLSYQEQDKPMIGVFNKSDFLLEEKKNNSLSNGVCDILNGTSEYSYYIRNKNGVTGIRSNHYESLFNWSDFGLDGNAIVCTVSISDEEFFTITNVNNTQMVNAYHIVKDKEALFGDINYITLGVAYTTSELNTYISEYNRYSANSKIKIIDYSKYNDEQFEVPEMGAASQLNQDIIKGDAPDMLLLSGFTNAEVLKKKGCFYDLYTFINCDKTLKKDDFLQNVLIQNEYDGQLMAIPINFSVSTIVGKKKYVGSKENWNLDSLILAYENTPTDMELMINANSANILDVLLYGNLSSFVDYDNQKCNFDSDDFINLLEMAKKIASKQQTPISDPYNDQFFGMINDKYLLCEANINCFDDFHALYKAKFNGEDITFVGYPSSDNTGAILSSETVFSIFNFSTKKEECWNFLKYFLSENKQKESEKFPINKAAFYYLANKACVPPIDEQTGKTINENYYNIGNDSIDIGYMTDKEKERYINYISDNNRSLVYDIQIYLICMEEINLFLAEEATAEQTANAIQNRVYIYINE